MRTHDWERVLIEAAHMGCQRVQFIGGEPTVHPDLNRFIRLATELEMRVEVYSNLVSLKPAHRETFAECHTQIATSFYSLRPGVHEAITGGRHSFQKTVANIKQVLKRGLPLRVGLIDMRDDQDIAETKQFLANLGVERMRVDTTRGVGRGEDLVQVSVPEDALCGACARGRAAVIPDGRVFPCVFSRHLTIGNVHEHSLQEIVAGNKMRQTRRKLTHFFQRKFRRDAYLPEHGEHGEHDEHREGSAPCMPATERGLRS